MAFAGSHGFLPIESLLVHCRASLSDGIELILDPKNHPIGRRTLMLAANKFQTLIHSRYINRSAPASFD
jgi:hypothetical protein